MKYYSEETVKGLLEQMDSHFVKYLENLPSIEVNEPHGRLVDADVLKAKIRLGVIIDSYKGRYKQMANVLVDDICSAIDESPSIIDGRTCWSCRECTDYFGAIT